MVMATETATGEALRIRQLVIKDFKRLHAVDITRTGHGVMVFTGANRSGKTSIFDGVRFALAGGGATPEAPVRNGAEKAHVELMLSDDLKDRYRVVAEVVKGKRSLVVTDLGLGPDGSPKRNAQTSLLDDMIGALMFDPLAFTNETNAEKRLAMLVAAAGISEAWDAKNAELEGAKITRRDAKTEAKRTATFAKSTPDPRPGEDLVEVGTAILVGELKVANGQLNERSSSEQHAGALRNEIAELDRRLLDLTRERDTKVVALNTINDSLCNTSIPDTAPIEEQIRTAGETNALYAKQQAHKAAFDAKVDAEDAAGVAESRVGDIRGAMRKLLTESPLATAVDGLGIDDDAVPTINGIHFDGCSGAEKVLLSAQIGMLANPRLRWMGIDEAGGLDAESLAVLDKLACDKRYDIWVACTGFDGSGDVQVVNVVDGRATSGTTE